MGEEPVDKKDDEKVAAEAQEDDSYNPFLYDCSGPRTTQLGGITDMTMQDEWE
jgi:hypothetical protein